MDEQNAAAPLSLDRRIQNVPPEVMAKWDEFVDRVDKIGEEMFPDGASVVLAAQFGPLGSSDDLPACLLTANMTACEAVNAVAAMMEFAEEHHAIAHRRASGFIVQETDQSALPEHIKQAIADYAAMHGMDPANVIVQEVADVSDLQAMPTYTPEEG